MRLQHEVVHAQYDSAAGKWCVRVRRPNTATGAMEELEDSADVLVTAIGVLSRWKWPDINGLKNFKGELFHSAGFEPGPKTWEEVAHKWTDKTVGVIGVVRTSTAAIVDFYLGLRCAQGSSGIQIVAALQPKVKKLVNYVRGKTWLPPPLGSTTVAHLLGREPGGEANRE